jgi:hypothetical protein
MDKISKERPQQFYEEWLKRVLDKQQKHPNMDMIYYQGFSADTKCGAQYYYKITYREYFEKLIQSINKELQLAKWRNK